MITTDAFIAAVQDMDKHRSYLDSEEYYDELDARMGQWAEGLAVEHNITHLPQQVQDKVFEAAQDQAVEGNYRQMASFYAALAEVASFSAFSSK